MIFLLKLGRQILISAPRIVLRVNQLHDRSVAIGAIRD